MRRDGSRPLVALVAWLGATAGACFAADAHAQIERRPYLQRVGPDEVTIVWTTTAPADSVVHLGDAPDALDRTVSEGASVTQHEVRVTGLAPDRTYHYDVGSTGVVLEGGDGQHAFRTAPTPGSATKMRGWVVGDSGTGESEQEAVTSAMLAHVGPRGLPQLYLHVGDMAYDAGTTSEFTTNFFAPYARVLTQVPLFTAIGNHEGGSSDSGTQSGPYYTAYVTPTAGELGGVPSGTEAYYGFDWGNVHFIVLDSHDSSRDPDGPMMTWMREDALASDRLWLVALWHHPPYTKGTHDSDDEGQLIDMRENALPILEAAGVDLVLAGHSHIYERSYLIDGAYDTPTTAEGHIVDGGDGSALGAGPYVKSLGSARDGAVYVVAGHGGAGLGGSADHPVMYFSEIAHGSCLLDVQGNRLALRNVRADGAITDRFTLVKGETALVVGSPDGGETVQPGSPISIRWATVGSVGAVDLDYSLDGGGSWQSIAEGVANDGEHAWTAPELATYSGLVRVRSASDETIVDESNGPFAIAAPPIEVVPFGATWKYRDQGADPGADWNLTATPDADWPEGPAQLGYGDDDEATTLLDADPNVPTVFFRRHFEIDDELLSGTVQVVYDDGIAVYVNGTRVFGANVPEGSPFDAYASSDSQDDAVGSATVPPELFVVGDNVVAVEVKQGSADSSDLSFDLRLEVLVAPPDPPPTTSSAGAGGRDSSSGASSANGASGANGEGGGTRGASSTGTASADAGSEPEDGCGCHAVGSSRAGGWASAAAPLALGMMAASAIARRRRRRSRTGDDASRATDQPHSRIR